MKPKQKTPAVFPLDIEIALNPPEVPNIANLTVAQAVELYRQLHQLSHLFDLGGLAK